MQISKLIYHLTKNPRILLLSILDIASPSIPTKLYLKLVFRIKLGYNLDLKGPKTFNEKLNWLKLNDRKPIYTTMVDKYRVKEYVANLIGEEYVVPCYGAWESFDEIDFSVLPEKFVLKANHDSSGATIIKNKRKTDFSSIRIKFKSLLRKNYYYHCREWPYKNVKPMVLAEMLLEDSNNEKLQDYKFWCFGGEPKYMYCTVKGGNVYENFFDMDFNSVEISHGYPRLTPEPSKPKNFELMKSLCVKLSQDIPFIRIDFFEVNGKLYFGEFTFYDWAGLKSFINKDIDLSLGKYIIIDKLA